MPAAALRADDSAHADPRLIVPLDLPTRAEAETIVAAIGDAVNFYKIGLELLATEGMAFARDLKAEGKQVFCDWKLHDIGNQVERATAAIAASGACDLLTVHAEPQVMAAAVRGRGGSAHMEIVGVTVLTSLSEGDLAEIGYGMDVRTLVARRVGQAQSAGLDGVVLSPHEAAMARAMAGPGFRIVNPGVRPAWAAKNDQARASTPAEALRAGADRLVCGRPITAATDPREAALRVAAEMAGASPRR